MTSRAELVREQIEQVEQDLADVDEQLAAGDLDEGTAESLRSTYRSELLRLEEALESAGAGEEANVGPSRRRMTAGVAILIIGFAAVTGLLLATVRSRAPGELVTGGIATDVVQGGLDLASVSDEEMEAVVAENPEIVGMRLALAGRYFEAGEFDKALPHYMTVLDQDEDNPEALSSVGWMTYLSGRPDVAETFVTRALVIAPEYAQAYWFLGNIRMFGLGDPAGAIEPFEMLLTFEAIPDEIREQAEELLGEAGS
ncbi:MAG TPA: tetratricopeptide repeat protein [Acidimicrobiia bacterium]|jgi:tetratricopeptide (TPR) repeat protein|nr:tetratricopeptide repeat protein [Acidimicrobiia bacterium]